MCWKVLQQCIWKTWYSLETFPLDLLSRALLQMSQDFCWNKKKNALLIVEWLVGNNRVTDYLIPNHHIYFFFPSHIHSPVECSTSLLTVISLSLPLRGHILCAKNVFRLCCQLLAKNKWILVRVYRNISRVTGCHLVDLEYCWNSGIQQEKIFFTLVALRNDQMFSDSDLGYPQNINISLPFVPFIFTENAVICKGYYWQ